MLAQLLSPAARTGAPEETALATVVAGLAALQVLAQLDGLARPASLAATLEVELPDGVTSRRPWPAHPACGCTWPPGGAAGPDRSTGPGRATMDPVTDLPRRAVTRTAKLATLPLGFAGRTALGLGKRVGGRPAELVAAEVQARTAEQLFKVLGELKGGAMKFGQALSIFEAALPEELAGPYRATLTKLQDAAPPMPAATVHRVLAAELGHPLAAASSREFDDRPAAAASIGQVHRGDLAGRPAGRREGPVPRRRGRADLRPEPGQPGRPGSPRAGSRAWTSSRSWTS